MSPEDEVIRAGEARQIIESAIFIEACKRIADSLSEQRRRVPVRDTDMHTRLIITEQLWGNIQDWLRETADTGKFASIQISQREQARRGLFGWTK
jgi:uncharacterized Zn finger protein